MCFYGDDNYDWYASINELSDIVIEKPKRCIECGRMMQQGETAIHLFQQEHEECHDCEEGDCKCIDGFDEDGCSQDHDCKCDPPNFGETDESYRCRECDGFLKAVEQHETDEGCPPHTRQPDWGQMIESISQFERKDALPYFRKANRMFPELKRSGYLKRIWGKMFDLEIAR